MADFQISKNNHGNRRTRGIKRDNHNMINKR